MNGAPVSVTVVLPTYNRRDVVETTLRHLQASDHDHSRLEVVVADNSTDGTPDMVRRVAAESDVPMWCLESDERLPAVKRNLALRAAQGDLVLFLNDDVWLRPDAVRLHVEAHRRQAGPAAVLGLVEQSDRMPWTPFGAWYRPFAYEEIAGRAGEDVGYRYHWSMNLSLPREVMLDRNLVFHEEWGDIGHEDVELGYRWTRAGLPVVYEPRARGEHFHPHTLDSACRLQASIGRGLRDLEVLVPDPDLLTRYGVQSRHADWRRRCRTGLRNLLFNGVTVPPLQTRLGRLQHRNRLAEWAYWKVLLHHTETGYRMTPRRSPTPTPTRPERVST